MSRVVELVKRFILGTGQSMTSVKSIRLLNGQRGENNHDIIIMIVVFKDSKFDETFMNCLNGVGFYIDDIIKIKRSDGQDEKIENPNLINTSEPIHSLEISFSYENRPVTTDFIIKKIQDSTIFGLPEILYKNTPIAKLEIYKGANITPIRLAKQIGGELRSYNGSPYIIEQTRTPFVEFTYLDDRSNLSTEKIKIVSYISQDLALRLNKHAYTSKVGIRVLCLFPPRVFSENTPLLNWSFLKDQAQKSVESDLVRHTSTQVARISHRINFVQNRAKYVLKNINFGLVPINEVETVLLFQRIALNYPHFIPGGLKVSILDYSPKDIDSICRFQLGPEYPEEIGPVEFEYFLGNFFKHGHDYKQVKLIICYTLENMRFPYQHGGITYELDRTGALPRLSNILDHSSIPCLILNELTK